MSLVRTTTRLQMEPSECGAVALGIVLEHLGRSVHAVTLRQQCGVSRDGTNAASILGAARRQGLVAWAFRQEPDQLPELPMPVILHWNFNHFVVLEGFRKGRAHLNDPATGRRTIDAEELDRAFTGVVLTFEPGPAFQPAGSRVQVVASLLARLRGAGPAVLYLVLAGVGLMVPALALPVLTQIFVDEILVNGKREWLMPLLGGMAGAALARAALTWLQRTHLVRLLMQLTVKMSTTFLWHLLQLPIDFFLARTSGDIASRVQLNDRVATLLSGRLAGALLDLLVAAAYLVLMSTFDGALAALGLGTAAVHVALLVLQQRGRGDMSLRISAENGKLAGVAAGGLTMIETLKATGAESAFFGRWAGHQAKLTKVQQALARRDQVIAAVIGGASRINSLLVLGVGALRVMDGHLTLGALVAVQSMMVSFLEPIESLTRFGFDLQQLRGHLDRLDDVLGHEIRPGDSAATPHRRLGGELRLQKVVFGYLPFSAPLVTGLDLHIAPGQRVALVGGSGSGKSTIAKLVCGLHQAWSGQICFDGQPRQSLGASSLASSIALVDQEISLFEGTVRDNLTLWDPTIPEADIVQAARDACIHEDITRLERGYDAAVGEGGFNFSGGQRQRLEIARALVRQPALLVMDEATSALDPETEHQVDINLRRRGVSCLIVAHRLSTIRDCDEILVLDQGRVAERGSHRQLMAAGGRYAELITAA